MESQARPFHCGQFNEDLDEVLDVVYLTMDECSVWAARKGLRNQLIRRHYALTQVLCPLYSIRLGARRSEHEKANRSRPRASGILPIDNRKPRSHAVLVQLPCRIAILTAFSG